MSGRGWLLALVMLLASSGCAHLRDAPVPMVVRSIPARCTAPVDTLVVLLPGAFDRPEDFIAEGFVDALKARGIAADVALVDATIPYYRTQQIVPRLEADVIGPARARGIRHIWLAGISLGGLGSLIYANEGREHVDGLLLMAPYLGERATVAEVAASGSLASWAPPGRIPDDDLDRRIWQVAKKLTVQRDATSPQVFLGFGVDDRFVAAHRLLAGAMAANDAADHVFTAPGGHDWPAWRAVWAAMLDAAPLPRDRACTR